MKEKNLARFEFPHECSLGNCGLVTYKQFLPEFTNFKHNSKMKITFLFCSLFSCLFILNSCMTTKAEEQNMSFPPEIRDLESRAEKGDTAAMHRLIEYYNENAVSYIEVEEVVDAEGNPVDLDEPLNDASLNYEFSDYCSARLEYWLTKGISMNDPIALAVKGYNLYYTDEREAIRYLSKAAENGDGKAALFCGSACLNQGIYADAIKFLLQAYELETPSAGWHLAMIYASGLGVESNRDEAINYLRHSAILNYPEAVLEMKRIEPYNPLWSHKADSLEIDFADFPIIP